MKKGPPESSPAGMDEFKTADLGRRVVTVMLGSGELGRPIVTHPATPPDRTKILREAFMIVSETALSFLGLGLRPPAMAPGDVCDAET